MTWGDDALGQTDVPASVLQATSVACGNYHTLALVPSARLRFYQLQGALVIRWSGIGVLQSAPTPSGPYQDVSGPSQAYTNTDMSGSARFFRLRRW